MPGKSVISMEPQLLEGESREVMSMEPPLPKGENSEVSMESSMENLQIKLDSPCDEEKVKLKVKLYAVYLALCEESTCCESRYLEVLRQAIGSRASEAYFKEWGSHGFLAYITKKEAKMLYDLEEVGLMIRNRRVNRRVRSSRAGKRQGDRKYRIICRW